MTLRPDLTTDKTDNAYSEVQNNIEQLKRITAALLTPVLHYAAVLEACNGLKDLFVKASEMVEDEKINPQDIFTGNGKAIGPTWAASCVTDMQRTRSFLRGIKEAVEDKLKDSAGKPVIVLYAGTGPFATLLTPLATVFTPAQLQLVLVEINPQSIYFLKRTIQQFAMEEYVVEVFEADAALFQIPDNLKPDIIVTETMLQALRNEPQVAVSVNLVSQCSSKTVLIPEIIEVKAGLTNKSIEELSDIYPLKTMLEFKACTAVAFRNSREEFPVLTEGLLVEIPQQIATQYTQLSLLTLIQVYKENRILYGQSGLTLPYVLLDLTGIDCWPAIFRLRYDTGAEPGFIMLLENSEDPAATEAYK